MRKNGRKRAREGLALIEMILVLAIIFFIIYKTVDYYVKKPKLDRETESRLLEQGIDTSSYKATVDTVRSKIEGIQKERLDNLMEMK